MYHDVTAEPPDTTGGGRLRFAIARVEFEQMLDAIEEGGYEGCSLSGALALQGRRRVAITFDDGDAGQFDNALPALLERQMTATFFVVTDWVGTPGFASWHQLREAVSLGMSVQSHSKSHPHLSELDEPSLRRELAESKSILDAELGQDTTQIALPGGDAPRRELRHLVAKCGYRVVAHSRWGTSADSLHADHAPPRWIHRCNAPASLTPGLARRIVRGDPWLAVNRVTREATLNGIRAVLGADRYARLRVRVLDALAARVM